MTQSSATSEDHTPPLDYCTSHFDGEASIGQRIIILHRTILRDYVGEVGVGEAIAGPRASWRRTLDGCCLLGEQRAPKVGVMVSATHRRVLWIHGTARLVGWTLDDTITTDSRSRRSRASRRGDQLLTRALGSSCVSACPHFASRTPLSIGASSRPGKPMQNGFIESLMCRRYGPRPIATIEAVNGKDIFRQIQIYSNDLRDTPPSLQLTFEIFQPATRAGCIPLVPPM
ncbi:hypothetical protein ABIB82_007506 [Bradyrhizobium sp. i1.8.4]